MEVGGASHAGSSSQHVSGSVVFDAPDATLLNPNFDAYKVIGSTAEDDDRGADAGASTSASSKQGYNRLTRECSYPLLSPPMGGVSGHAGKGRVTAGHKQYKDWGNMSRLVPGVTPGQALYISNIGWIMLVVLDANARPLSYPIYYLCDDIIEQLQEEPALVALDPGRWVLSDGEDGIILLKVSRQGGPVRLEEKKFWNLRHVEGPAGWRHQQGGPLRGEERATWNLRDIKGLPFPSGWRVRAARQSGQDLLVALQATRRSEGATRSRPGVGRSGASSDAAKGLSSSQVHFDLALCTLPLLKDGTKGTRWRSTLEAVLSVEEPPYSVHFDQAGNLVLLGETGVRLRTVRYGEQAMNSARTTQQAGRQETSCGGDKVLANPIMASTRVPPFAWLQTTNAVKITFQLPACLRQQDIRCVFGSQSIDLSVVPSAPISAPPIEVINEDVSEMAHADSIHERNLKDLDAGRYTKRPLWGEIDAGSCFSIWEKPQGREPSGLLTLHLVKKHAGTRWVSAFKKRSGAAQASITRLFGDAGDEQGIQDEADAELEEVPEMLDPSEVQAMLDGLEKYTAAEGSGIGARSLGGADGVMPSLLQDGLEEEDAEVGRACVATVTNSDTATFSRMETLLARALPSSGPSHDTTVVTRHDLDGLLYTRHDDHFQHTDTFPALSYILASKGDTQHVFVHMTSPARPACTLAFEGGLGSAASQMLRAGEESTSGAGNLFVYYSPKIADNDDTRSGRRIASEGHSRVIRLGAGDRNTPASGHYVAAAAVRVPVPDDAMDEDQAPKDVLLVLSQQRLLVLHNVL